MKHLALFLGIPILMVGCEKKEVWRAVGLPPEIKHNVPKGELVADDPHFLITGDKSISDQVIVRWKPEDGEFVACFNRYSGGSSGWTIKTEKDYWQRPDIAPYEWREIVFPKDSELVQNPQLEQTKNARIKYIALPQAEEEIKREVGSYEQSIIFHRLLESGSPAPATEDDVNKIRKYEELLRMQNEKRKRGERID